MRRLAELALGVCMIVGAAVASAGAAAPVVTIDAAIVDFDDIGLYRIGYAYRGQPERDLPLGWNGPSDDATGVTYMPQGLFAGKSALLLHPPWRGGAGLTYQEFASGLPRCSRILLRGATALRPEAVGKSDGVTFRVLCEATSPPTPPLAGEGRRKLLEVNRKDGQWQDFTIDLTEFAGKVVTIRFETDPGPKDDCTWDHAFWGSRQLVLEGFKPKPARRRALPPLDLSKLCSTANRSVVPLSGFGGKREIAVQGDTAVFRHKGPDGVLEYRWTKPGSGDPLFGKIELIAGTPEGQSTVPLASMSKMSWTAPAEFVSSRFEGSDGGATCLITYKVGDEEAVVRVLGHMTGKSLVFDVSCDKPVVSAMQSGGWNLVPIRKPIPVPYYSGQVFYAPKEDIFLGALLDWTASNASSHENTLARYAALTDGSRNCLKERAVFTAAWHLAETLPNIPNPQSPYIRQIGGKIVLDTWGGAYTTIGKQLQNLWDYGIRDCIVLVHVWQRSGYDNALPAHIPAMESLGGDEGMKTLVSTARKLGYLIALHENYVDYYPNYENFDPNDIALDSDGGRVNGWYNPGTKIQAFQIKPNSIVPLAKTQSPEAYRRYGANASYLDVNSAVPPWWHVDCRAGEQGAGTFEQMSLAFRQLWQFERDNYKGPVFGEGNNHWYWSGYLDGAEAQFGSGWPWAQGPSAPLAVDFDLLRIHPLQFNHGMGYYVRWDEPLGYQGKPPMVTLDQYRMQEIAYGHAGFLGATTWNLLPVTWIEHHLMTPVTSRYASARPADIRYLIGGKWVDATAATKAGVWDRVRVRYDNGLEITANGGSAPMTAGGQTLPRFGWLATGAGVTAYTALREGVVVDYAETGSSVFANARRASDWDYAKVWDLMPKPGKFEQIGERKFRLTYEWQVGEKPPVGYTCFVHFIGRNAKGDPDAICFQDDHSVADSAWIPGKSMSDGPHEIVVPAELGDGDYKCCLGLYRPDVARLSIRGGDNPDKNVCLGTVHVRDGGRTITFDPQQPSDSQSSRIANEHLNLGAKVIDFGVIRTNGSVLIRREGSEWVLTPMPRDKAFVIRLKASKFGAPRRVRCTGGRSSEGRPVLQGGWWTLQMNGAKEYRW